MLLNFKNYFELKKYVKKFIFPKKKKLFMLNTS